MKREALLAIGLSAALVSTATVGSNHNAEALSKRPEAVTSPTPISRSTSQIGALSIKSELGLESQATRAKLPTKPKTHPFSNLPILKPAVEKPPIDNGTIYILGDSLTEGMQLLPAGETLADRLEANGWTPMINAHCGRPLVHSSTYESCDNGHPTELTAFSQILEPKDQKFIKHAEAISIELGTNDFYQPTDLFTLKARALVNDLHKINPSAEIFWMNTFLKGKGDGFHGINLGIAKSGAKVIDFAGHAESFYPNASEIHPIEDGYRAMVNDTVIDVGRPKN